MKPRELPIAFNQLMVPALMGDRKTRTRRVVTPQPPKSASGFVYLNDAQVWAPLKVDKTWTYLIVKDGKQVPCKKEDNLKCPFGEPGDLLWVREDHQVDFEPEKRMFFVTYRDGEVMVRNADDLPEATVAMLLERKTLNSQQYVAGRYLPKALARTWLMNTGVRIEPLHEITNAEAELEGVEKRGNHYRHYMDKSNNLFDWLRADNSFFSLWERLNGEENRMSNPWVWVLAFEVVSKTGKPDWNKVRDMREAVV